MPKSGKKHREKKPTQDEANKPMEMDSIANQNTTASNTNSNLFSSLFGEIPDGNATASIFSDNNPFRRKADDVPQEPQNRQELESGDLATSEGSSELKKGKRKKDKNGVSEVDINLSEKNEVQERKKSKRDQFGDSESAEHLEGHEEEKKNEKKKKKKRKRDEVEAEYEAKKYGVTQQEEKGEEGGVVGRKRKEMESVEDILVSKEGFDDESKLLRTVFVGNLPLKIKKKQLVKEFGKFGEVESVRIRSIPLTDVSVYSVIFVCFNPS